MGKVPSCKVGTAMYIGSYQFVIMIGLLADAYESIRVEIRDSILYKIFCPLFGKNIHQCIERCFKYSLLKIDGVYTHNKTCEKRNMMREALAC